MGARVSAGCALASGATETLENVCQISRERPRARRSTSAHQKRAANVRDATYANDDAPIVLPIEVPRVQDQAET